MAIQQWSENIKVVELTEDPQFTDEMAALMDGLSGQPCDVVLNLAAVGFLNSSNVSRLLRLRKQMITTGRRLVLCGVTQSVWGVFVVTGLDKIFQFTKDVATALASIQLSKPSAKE